MSNKTLAMLRRSWRAWFDDSVRDAGPRWLRLVWTFVFSAGVALAFTVIGFAAMARGEDAWRDLNGWWTAYQVNLVVSLVITYLIHALFATSKRLLGAARIHGFRPVQRTLYFSGVPMLGVALGWPAGAWLTRSSSSSWEALQSPNAVVASVLISLLITFVFHHFFAAKSRQIEAEKRATEAQLRLLQAQMEPHFLFNTLANVQALIDHDTAKAKQMLESFTDYLRSSLTSLRREDATLGSELDLAQAYLGLLKTRMEDRLQFSIECEPPLRGAKLPPLVLQPLIENAIHHGIEPKVEGGQLRVSAKVQGSRLWIEVTDDGQGLDGPARRRGGTGMALANLRERLLAQYGSDATLTLESGQPGTVVTLRLPYQTTPRS
jgi:signal transduction histidine kinase